jgi:hypothetical protein
MDCLPLPTSAASYSSASCTEYMQCPCRVQSFSTKAHSQVSGCSKSNAAHPANVVPPQKSLPRSCITLGAVDLWEAESSQLQVLVSVICLNGWVAVDESGAKSLLVMSVLSVKDAGDW